MHCLSGNSPRGRREAAGTEGKVRRGGVRPGDERAAGGERVQPERALLGAGAVELQGESEGDTEGGGGVRPQAVARPQEEEALSRAH